MRTKLLLILLLVHRLCTAQLTSISGRLIDSASFQPVEGASIIAAAGKITAITNAHGNFTIIGKLDPDSRIIISSLGYQPYYTTIKILGTNKTLSLTRAPLSLNDVKVLSTTNNDTKSVSQLDLHFRSISNSQEVLRLIPGLFIGQHQGGGKAEQIFLRGFDCDHGTDIALFADGLPVNMVSHAHGQGYADSHFIIPETIATVNFRKGPYYADKGDFTTTGFVDFNTLNSLDRNRLRLEGGMFNSFRLLGMFNLLGPSAAEKNQSWYIATDFNYTDAWFDHPQHFRRFNFFTKYNGKLSEHTDLSVSASTFTSTWHASGQVPDRAVREGLIGFYGALDPNEGGQTSRTNINAKFTTTLRNGDLLKNQVAWSHYFFDLHTNFTFFLIDTVNGDEIRQRESRNMAFTNTSYSHSAFWGSHKFTTEFGFTSRFDFTGNSELSHTKDQTTIINDIKLGNISQISFAPWLATSIALSPKLTVYAGIRRDQFYHQYDNKFSGDTSFGGIGRYSAKANLLSPKLSLYYHVNEHLQFYLAAGKGFHSNDTRVVVLQKGKDILPAAYGFDAGAILKPYSKLLLHVTAWYLCLNREFVYGGDGATVDFNGRTRRLGFDFSGRVQPLQSLYLDLDINYAHGRSIDDRKGMNYIPLAPVWTSTAGITYAAKKGINGSLRYRYIGDRPANEDNSLTASGYFIMDAVLNYSEKNWEIGLSVNNILDKKWKETQFATETRLKNESMPVTEICFTPGTPLAAKLSFTVYFR